MLVSSTLQASLLSMFQSQPGSAADAAKQWAKCYDDYAKTATAGVALPMFTTLEVKGLENTLLAAIQNPKTATAATTALAWATGVVSYWMLPPVMFMGPPTGPVILAAPALPVIQSILLACFSNTANTAATAAQQMATALDMGTKLIMVAVVPPPGNMVPIT